MTVYILREYIYSHNCGDENNTIDVYDSEEKVEAKIAEMIEAIMHDKNFFMKDIFDDDDFDEDMDVREIEADGVHLYCDGNGDTYDLYYETHIVK